MSTSETRTQHYRPYFGCDEVQFLREKQRGKHSQTQDERTRQQACAFIDAVGVKLGFPKRTTSTAQALYQRFHLYFHKKTWYYVDVTLAALYVSSKINDTLKKPRDLIMTGYVVRHPELAAKSKAIGGEIDVDPVTVAADTEKLLGVERLMLEVLCFNFTMKVPFPYVIKICRELKATKALALLAWRLTIDSNRTMVPLCFPPHTIALGCVYVAALLTSFETPAPTANDPAMASYRASHEVAALLGKEGDWEMKYKARAEDLDEIAHILVDLLHGNASTLMMNSSPTSPSTNTNTPATPVTPSSPSSPHPYSSHPPSTHSNPNLPPPPPYKPDMLIRLKIAMRGKNLRPRKRKRVLGKDPTESQTTSGKVEGIGTNSGTTRFLFGPPDVSMNTT